MNQVRFRTKDGKPVPAVTAGEMREVDRIAVEDFGLGILQMMENAGRNLALNVIDMLGDRADDGARVTVLAGAGGNGGGGLCCARHLHNRGFLVHLLLDREENALRGAAASQLRILREAGLQVTGAYQATGAIRQADVVVDALIGYSLRGAPRGRTAELIELSSTRRAHTGHAARRGPAAGVLSLDVPSGLAATTGKAPGVVVRPERTLTLALPKTGLTKNAGELFLADIGIPPEVYEPLGLSFEPFFGGRFWIPLKREGSALDQDAGA